MIPHLTVEGVKELVNWTHAKLVSIILVMKERWDVQVQSPQQPRSVRLGERSGTREPRVEAFNATCDRVDIGDECLSSAY